MPTLKTSLWFDDNLEEAMGFYTSIFPDSRVGDRSYYGPEGPGPEGTLMAADFEMCGLSFTGINGGPQYSFTPAISLVVSCADQAEIDHYWSVLGADGGEEVACGWVTDKFGLSWQVVPANLSELLHTPEQVRAMLSMKKLVIAELEAAGAA